MDVPKLSLPKIIGDPVHGPIPLTTLEYDLLQLPTLNRLHYVKQTATAYLTFPGSVTTRFSHVIGALHVGHQIITQLIQNTSDDYYDELFKKSKKEFIIKSVRLACLFHDIGHGPFSHSAERAMLEVTKLYHKKEISEAKKLFMEDEDDIPIHEFFSYKLVNSGEIAKTIKQHSQGGENLLKSISSLLVKAPITYAKKYPQGYSILRKIISSQLDADRMDYLLRDSLMSGVQFGRTDITRIINNMSIVKRKRPGKFEIAIHARALGNVEDMLDARFKMYKWFYQHHAVTATNALIRRAIERIIHEREEIAELFHWTSYAEGKSTDENVLSIIKKFVSRKSSYHKFFGIVDRRYLPISVFKHIMDYSSMIEKIKEESDLFEDNKVVLSKINSFFLEKSPPLLKEMFEDKGNPLRDIYVFSEDFPRKPYEPLSEKNTILIFGTSKDDKLRELTTISPYAVKINEEWEDFPNLFVFYLIPNRRKRESSREEVRTVRNIIAQAVARSQ
ncbi:MAG: HD domain-containing protein [Nitrosotalea sp.]